MNLCRVYICQHCTSIKIVGSLCNSGVINEGIEHLSAMGSSVHPCLLALTALFCFNAVVNSTSQPQWPFFTTVSARFLPFAFIKKTEQVHYFV